MSAKDIIINDDIHDTIQIGGVVYHKEAFRKLFGADLDGKTFRFVSTPEKYHGSAFSIELVEQP